MRNVTTLSLLMCLCASWVYSQDREPARGYALKPVPLGYPLKPVPISEVKLGDGFWSQRMKTHITVTIPHVLGTLGIDYSDPKPSISALALVRTLEGVAYCLMIERDQKSERMMDKISASIGDLYGEGNRWYGGCPEGAVFFYFATGKATLYAANSTTISLPAVERLADEERPLNIHLVPYYSWDNRGDKSMIVWIPRSSGRGRE